MRPWFIALPFLACAALSAEAAGPAVTVEARREGGNVVYTYAVANATLHPVAGIWIGYDEDAGLPELTSAPLDWHAGGGNPPGIGAPAGWSIRIVTMQGVALFAAQLSPLQQGATLAPGAAVGGWKITIAHPDKTYAECSYRLAFSDGTPTAAGVVTMTSPDDSQPPSLGVKLSPEYLQPADGRLVAITAEVSVSDDTDKKPDVQLDRIVCSDDCPPADIVGAALGTDDRTFQLRAAAPLPKTPPRTYVVTYTATDLAGNVTTAQAAVTVVPR